MKRVVVEELLDSDAGTPAEVAGSLKDLRMFNSVFGGVHTMSSLLRRVAHKRGLKQISWVDVAGGEGYVATRTQRSLARSGISSQPVMVDRASTHLGNTHPAVCGDALALPFRDNSFDAVGCSLFMHHLEPAEIVRFAREGLRVARHAFLIRTCNAIRCTLRSATWACLSTAAASHGMTQWLQYAGLTLSKKSERFWSR